MPACYDPNDSIPFNLISVLTFCSYLLTHDLATMQKFHLQTAGVVRKQPLMKEALMTMVLHQLEMNREQGLSMTTKQVSPFPFRTSCELIVFWAHFLWGHCFLSSLTLNWAHLLWAHCLLSSLFFEHIVCWAHLLWGHCFLSSLSLSWPSMRLFFCWAHRIELIVFWAQHMWGHSLFSELTLIQLIVFFWFSELAFCDVIGFWANYHWAHHFAGFNVIELIVFWLWGHCFLNSSPSELTKCSQSSTPSER